MNMEINKAKESKKIYIMKVGQQQHTENSKFDGYVRSPSMNGFIINIQKISMPITYSLILASEIILIICERPSNMDFFMNERECE